MKNIKNILAALAFGLLLAACGQNTDTHQHNTEEAIVLNNGQKWKVVPPMMAHIRNMETDAKSFEGSTLAEHKTLATKLQTNLNLLTSNCTMTGQAHDELHKWLLPYIGMVNDFAKAETKEDAAAYAAKIKESFTVLNTYFE